MLAVVVPQRIRARNTVHLTMDGPSTKDGGSTVNAKVRCANAVNGDIVPSCEETTVDHVTAKPGEDLQNPGNLLVQGIVGEIGGLAAIGVVDTSDCAIW